MSQPDAPRTPPVPPAVAIALTLAGFFALVIAAFGMVSLLADVEVVPVAGVGQAPGIVGVLLACGVYAAGTALVLRPGNPAYTGALFIAVAVWFVYSLSAGVVGAVASEDVAVGLSLMARLLTGWQGGVVGIAAAVAAWCAIALVRTRAGRPRWPWEGRDEA
ncbi:hypothetical protein [Microbacterium sp. SORGH_AS_0862]|uniref:hypothetical protein n=1 Tax=Microbacterium sp. SORGH_AS_0862 TaxID=3041789 RepID=UPI00279103B2|nr:hypothetical protein [Microbacterium sp. SORGH_AS_0862]MDQ1205638.1 Trk-type K+ transport system membrane component [Microbacterium sp. SORGH_AS_0862]